MDKTEREITWYSALLITLMVNAGRLMALRQNGIIAQYWQFDIIEYSFQILYNLFFCWGMFYLNLTDGKWLSVYRLNRQSGRYIVSNLLLVMVVAVLGNMIQQNAFSEIHIPGMIGRGYIRFFFSSILIAIIIRILLLMRESKKKDNLNEQLKTLYFQAQLELLKAQLNPHLLFNSLSSLSGIVREDPKRAQGYILHLSKVLRNTLVHSGSTLISVEEELTILKSYGELIAMRWEQAFVLNIEVSPQLLQAQIPHLSLQPLLENASKHNVATTGQPLIVNIYDEDGWLVVSNNRQPLGTPENSTGIGLVNINERFRLLVHRDIEIQQTQTLFLVKLPLLL